MDTIPLCLGIIVLILLSAYFSATETAFSSLNMIRLKNLASDGNERAKLTLRLAQDYDRLLSSILIGNNVVNILSASLATILFTRLIGGAGVSVSTIVMTLLVLVFGEISPKTIAKKSPDSFAMKVAPSIRVVMVVLTPFNLLFDQWRKLLNRVFKREDSPGFSDEEFITLVEEAENDGDLDTDKGELLRSTIEFYDLDAEEILTARVDMVAISEDATPDTLKELCRTNGHSRYPVYRGNLDTIIGVVYEKDFFLQLEPDATDIRALIKPILFISPQMKASALLRELQQSKIHMAVVVDEFGGTMGIITMEDILEELVGEIWDEYDQEDITFIRLPDGGWRIACQERLEELFEELAIEGDAEDYDAITIGGWVSERLGHLPNVGDAFDYGGMRFVVTVMDHRRVLWLEAHVIETEGVEA